MRLMNMLTIMPFVELTVCMPQLCHSLKDFALPQNMVNAVRRLPQIPQVGAAVSTQESSSTTGGLFSKLFRRSGNNPGLTEQQIQQQQLQLQQQRLLAQQQQQQLMHNQGGLQNSLSQPQGLASLAGGLAGQQQQQLLAQQQQQQLALQQGGLQVSLFVPFYMPWFVWVLNKGAVNL